MNEITDVRYLKSIMEEIFIFDIPSSIMEEIDTWVDYSRKIKDHPLADLRAHENVGYLSKDGIKHNSYQCGISTHLIEDSFWLAWVLRLTTQHWAKGRNVREFKLKDWNGYYDKYDIWTNFTYKGDDNPPHNHPGFLSGVIYYKNHGHPTIFNDYNCEYEGKNGTMIMFPSDTIHSVLPFNEDEERITIAFNIAEAEFYSRNGYQYTK